MEQVELLKQLRLETDAPIKDCLQAIKETSSLEEAKAYLKQKGLTSTRLTQPNEGYIGIAQDGDKFVYLIVKCETDFVSRNEVFRQLVNDAAYALILSNEMFKVIDDFLGEAKMRFKENIQVQGCGNRVGNVVTYVYQDGKRASIVNYEGDAVVAKKIAIQIVATQPKNVSREDVDSKFIDELMKVEIADAMSKGKNEKIATRIAEGKVSNQLKDFVLLEQPMYDNPKLLVKDFLKETGTTITRFELLMVEKQGN
jgi:elongation factor Ts